MRCVEEAPGLSRNPEPAGFEAHDLDKLERRSVRSAAVTLGAQAARLSLGLVGLAVLARLLAPRDFGLVAMAAAALALLTAIRELGLSLATVQRQQISHAQVSTLFWINLAFALGLWAAMAGVAPLLALLYGEPRITAIALVLAASLPLGAISAQHRAILQRRMEFRVLAGCDVVALGAGTCAGIAAASAGAGTWALVLMPLVTEAVASVLVWMRCPWRPGRPVRGAGIRGMLAFGGQLTVANMLRHGARHMDKILLGWACGPAAVGLYGRAYQLVLLPIQQVNAPVSSVAIPALSRLQREPERFRRFYLTALRHVVLATLPVIIALAVLAPEVVSLALGPAWAEAAPLLVVLACAGYVQIIANTAGWLFVTLGHTRRMMAWNAVAGAALIAAFVLGLPWGPLGVAVSYAVCMWLLRIPHFTLALRGTPVSGRDVWDAVRRPIALSGVAGAAMLLARTAAAAGDAPTRVGSTLAAGLVAWLTALAVWPAARADAAALISLLRLLRPASGAAPAPARALEQRS
jgi:PST family polysaccharide transporter